MSSFFSGFRFPRVVCRVYGCVLAGVEVVVVGGGLDTGVCVTERFCACAWDLRVGGVTSVFVSFRGGLAKRLFT